MARCSGSGEVIRPCWAADWLLAIYTSVENRARATSSTVPPVRERPLATMAVLPVTGLLFFGTVTSLFAKIGEAARQSP